MTDGDVWAIYSTDGWGARPRAAILRIYWAPRAGRDIRAVPMPLNVGAVQMPLNVGNGVILKMETCGAVECPHHALNLRSSFSSVITAIDTLNEAWHAVERIQRG